MATRIHAIEDLSERQVGAWRALADDAAEPNPFFEPEFVLPAARHLGGGEVGLLVVEDGGGWSACLPVTRVQLAGFAAGLGTWRHSYCFLGTPLIARDRLESAPAALVRHGLDQERVPLFIAEMLSEGPVLGALRTSTEEQGLAVVFEADHERAALERRSRGGYLDGMRAHRRRELQRLWRRLEEDLGYPLELEEDLGRSAQEAFLELEASGWKGQAATALGADPAHADFFRELCTGFAAGGRLQLLSLRAGDRVVAAKCNIGAGDGLFCFKIAHAEELRRYSPGVQLERLNVDVFHERREERFMDSCADPDNLMINRLWPDRRRIVSLVLGRRGARSAVSRHGLRAVHRVRGGRQRRRASTRS